MFYEAGSSQGVSVEEMECALPGEQMKNPSIFRRGF
jgi:hypothetical protein